jgi:prophage regulatory protein
MTSPSRPRLLKIAEVCEWICVSRSTIYKWVQEGTFPKPLILGGGEDNKTSASRWREDEVTAWLDQRPRVRDV